MWIPLAGRMLSGSCALVEGAHLVGPHAGGVHDGATAHVELLAVGLDRRRGHPPVAVLAQAAQRGVGGDGRSVRGRRARHGQAEPGVVGPGVVVEVGAGQTVGGHRGEVGQRLVLGEALVDLADAGPAGEVVAPHRHAHRPGHLRRHDPVLGQDRDEERQRADQVGRQLAQPLALGQGLVDQDDLPLLEVAQPAVDELGALRRRARGQVALVDEGRAEPPRRGVEGHADARDPAPHDQDVERLAGQAPQHGGAVEGDRRHDGVILGARYQPVATAPHRRRVGQEESQRHRRHDLPT